jgi:glycosyltransferase involved in cell wall biosynthesis
LPGQPDALARNGFPTPDIIKIWLITPYGSLPGEGWRDYRFTMIADALARRGHEVTWWTASFDHISKRMRPIFLQSHQERRPFRLELVPTPAYKRNIGLGRLRFELAFAYRLVRMLWHKSRPNVIIAADPPQTSGFAAVILAHRHQAKLILDCMDLRPEIFVAATPSMLRGLAMVIFAPLQLLRRYNYSRADAATATCDTYRNIVLRAAPRLNPENVITIFIGIDPEQVAVDHESPAVRKGEPNEFRVVYAGSLGQNYDIHALVECAALLSHRGDIRFVIAGDGPLRPFLLDTIRDRRMTNVQYLGRIARSLRRFKLCKIKLIPRTKR